MFNWQKILTVLGQKENVVFSTSFSLEDQIITDFIAKNNLNIEIFTIDTGRLFSQTYDIWQKTLDKYQILIKSYYPNDLELQHFVENSGINAFYDSINLRKECCNIRKIEPLKRALKDKDFWISGIRKEHSQNRSKKEISEFDDNLKITKFYPLLDLKENEIWQIIRQEDIPYNKLYDQEFESIGCAPCTRSGFARDGRWWWENGENKKECGLHSN
ncbi:phosphoadenylyl-sulfate reductase [Rickettsiales bacterium]|nr:phosphoadenylyl-sulfate reductase [Rickettsiales bacterium]